MSDPTATLAKLLGASSIDDHEEVLKAANAAIKASKGSNTDAQHTRVVALLKLDRFDDALRAIADAGSALESQASLEKAYALYKTGQHDEADKALRSGGSSSSRALRHLSAQIAYRAERFEAAARLYAELEKNNDGIEGEENDIKINRLATHAQLEWSGAGGVLSEAQKQPSREDLEAFETAFNSACGCIARGDLSKASVLLKRARDLCEASEDLTSDEKKAELLPIIIQHAYVLARLGKDGEAAALQKSIELPDITEAPTKAVASNNQVAIGDSSDAKNNNPYVTQRLAESATTLAGNDKLFEYQAAALRRNKYALDLQCQKFDGVQRATTKTILASSDPEKSSTAAASPASAEIASLGVISAAAKARLQTGKAALHEILPVLEKRPTDIGLLLTIIQLYVQTSNPGPALDLLDAFLKRLDASTAAGHEDVRFAPGLVAVAVALYRLQGRQAAIRNELARASTHWRSKTKEDAATSSALLREAGVELLKSSDPAHVASAGATFDSLVSSSSSPASKDSNPLAVAGLVASFATTDYAKVEPYLASLTPVERLISGAADIESLLSAGVATVPTHHSTTTTTSSASASKKRGAAAATTDDAGKAAGSKKRRIRYPKGFHPGDPGNAKPDPERWLPLRDRSTYRPKGRKGKKRAQESTQGGAVARDSKEEGETLELAGGAGHVKVETGAAAGGAGGGAGKGKKKKGKK
ncbi:hypothetical protein Micbo1qcDRAFT_160613 [Microdochium bolleyi]|uniref:Signal recognition particle subunit SRP72 n=1 Tax=Microdochium bolleyi TaxID=196109 RepID=A0A136J6I5_9PEZI|nr:hypothetical protein Micbo1qcDRAFT_160613 [Microdochium bolleyi]